MKKYNRLIYSNAHCSIIGGGTQNVIRCESPWNFIGGGLNNIIGQLIPSFVGNSHNVIGGGCDNFIEVGDYNVILGGNKNLLIGQHNAILGGTGNCDNGFNCVGIYGNGIRANMDCAFFANNFVVQNMPIIAGPSGLLYKDPSTGAVSIS